MKANNRPESLQEQLRRMAGDVEFLMQSCSWHPAELLESGAAESLKRLRRLRRDLRRRAKGLV